MSISMSTLRDVASKPPGPVFVTAADARRMEAAEEYGALRHAQALRAERPESGIAWEEFGGGHLIFVAKQRRSAGRMGWVLPAR